MGFGIGVLSALGLANAVLVAVSLTARRRFRKHSGVFSCRLLRRGSPWPVSRRQARWIHDVLVLQSGPLGLSTLPVAARITPGAVLRHAGRPDLNAVMTGLPSAPRERGT